MTNTMIQHHALLTLPTDALIQASHVILGEQEALRLANEFYRVKRNSHTAWALTASTLPQAVIDGLLQKFITKWDDDYLRLYAIGGTARLQHQDSDRRAA